MNDKQPFRSGRRAFLAASALAGVGVTGVRWASALADAAKDEAARAGNLAPTGQTFLIKRDHAKELWALKPAVIKTRPPFDLEDPAGNWLAMMKATSSTIGRRTYVSSYYRTFACPMGQPAVPFFGGAGAWTHQLVEPSPEILQPFGEVPRGTMMQLALFTGVILDPFTFKPVQQIRNPYTGKMVDTRDSVYAESYLVYPGGGMTSLERPEVMSDRAPQRAPYVRSGRKLSFNLAALFSGEGPHQPRMDASWWTADYADLMNPDVPDVDADYAWTGLMQGRDSAWWGFGPQDPVQVLWNVHGTVAKSQKSIEPIVQEYVFSKYPERV